jgi:hypothetical protein
MRAIMMDVVYDRRGAVLPPNGCALCGVIEREHCQHYYGLHFGADRPRGYVIPDDALRLKRMKARRMLQERAARARSGPA